MRRVYETIVAVSITFFCVCETVCVYARAGACAYARVALLIQHATPRHIVICDLCSWPYFSTSPINGAIFGKKLLNIKYVFLFSLEYLLEKFLIP
jgi:hypothetical protein